MNELLEGAVLLVGAIIIAVGFHWLGRKDGIHIGYRFGWVDGVREAKKSDKGRCEVGGSDDD